MSAPQASPFGQECLRQSQLVAPIPTVNYFGVGGTGSVRPFPCPVEGCGKSFQRSEHVQRHVRTHTGERPFNCSHEGCGRRFSRTDELKRHQRTHDRERASHEVVTRAVAISMGNSAMSICNLLNPVYEQDSSLAGKLTCLPTYYVSRLP